MHSNLQISDPISLQRELFCILEEFFKRATGLDCTGFGPISKFAEQVKRNAHLRSKDGIQAFGWCYERLGEYYDKFGVDLFCAGRTFGGAKLVVGGASNFTETHLDSVRKTLLYSDTILIPDPVFPWIERPRIEERFRHVLFLRNALTLLHLKPLVDAQLPYPAVFVFPSWEKTLESADKVTRYAILELVTQILSSEMNARFDSFDALIAFAARNKEKFIDVVERRNLFVAPEGEAGDSLRKSLRMYKHYIKTWRSESYVQRVANLPDVAQILTAIVERIAHQYHLLENATELRANPMLCLPVHWHYYQICSQFFEQRLRALSIIDDEAIASARALNQPQLHWLGNVSIRDLVELRISNENEAFRRQIEAFTHKLNSASFKDLNRVTAEVSRGVASLIAEHQNAIRKIQRKYQRKHTQTAVGAWITFTVVFLPALAPFLPAATVAGIIAKYAWDKVSQRQESQDCARSLMGVLAGAKAAH